MFNWHWPPSKVAIVVLLVVLVIGRFGIQIPLQDWARENECWAIQLNRLTANHVKKSIPFHDQAGFEAYLDDRVTLSDVVLTGARWMPAEACASYVVESEVPVAEVARNIMLALDLPIAKLELGVTNNHVLISLYCRSDEGKER